jgi:hypothetical protein
MDAVLLIIPFQISSKNHARPIDVGVAQIQIFVSRTQGDSLVKFVLQARSRTDLAIQWQSGCAFFAAIGWRGVIGKTGGKQSGFSNMIKDAAGVK